MNASPRQCGWLESFLRTLACTALVATLALMLDVPVASAQARVLPYRDGEPIPEGYSLDESMYRGPAVMLTPTRVGSGYGLGIAGRL